MRLYRMVSFRGRLNDTGMNASKSVSTRSERWTEGWKGFRQSTACCREGRFPEAIRFLDEAHNLGRDNVMLHAASHLQYARCSFHAGDMRRALGHLYHAATSPILVPIDRARRAGMIGDWRSNRS